jgi:NAD(P)-dependent dehydrogenase (short-subunit alcohol dehydrogenase family)
VKPSAFEDLKGKVCVITGGGGAIGRVLAEGLASAGVLVAVLGRSETKAAEVAAGLTAAYGTRALGMEGNVVNRESLLKAQARIHQELGPVELLVNCAGGNSPKATTQAEFVDPSRGMRLEGTFYGLDLAGFTEVFDLNFVGTVLPTMVFTEEMVARKAGVVLNVSSMNSFRPLTKIPAYSAAKASINNFTQWLAVHLAKVNVRVNALAPGFFLTNQNRFLLTDQKSGELTPRGGKIISLTPAGRFGAAEELQGPTLFLLSNLSQFVTGVVLPVDGGFSAYSGV